MALDIVVNRAVQPAVAMPRNCCEATSTKGRLTGRQLGQARGNPSTRIGDVAGHFGKGGGVGGRHC